MIILTNISASHPGRLSPSGRQAIGAFQNFPGAHLSRPADVGLLDAFEVETTLSGAARLAGLEAGDVKATIASARNSAWQKQQFAEQMRSRTDGTIRRARNERQ